MILDVIIIGAGQAGLSSAYFLDRESLDYIVLEKTHEVASAWKLHYDSLKLITPYGFNSLPGKKFESESIFPSKNEVVDYLESYALPYLNRIYLDSEVVEVTKGDLFTIKVLSNNIEKEYQSKNIIVASGYNATKYFPSIRDKLSNNIVQLHSSEYKNYESLSNSKSVLVIGSGNSGVSIAVEVSKFAMTYLASGKIKRWPRKVAGIDIFNVAKTLGLFKMTSDTFIGKILSKKLIPMGDATYGVNLQTISRKYNIELLDRIINIKDDFFIDEKGKSVKVDAVIWATGYRPDYSFLKFNIFDNNNLPFHDKGITDIPGLYFLGLKWQTNISSFLLYGVGKDAELIVSKIKKTVN